MGKALKGKKEYRLRRSERGRGVKQKTKRKKTGKWYQTRKTIHTRRQLPVFRVPGRKKKK